MTSDLFEEMQEVQIRTDAFKESEERLRVLIVDDHQILRDGLMACLANEPDLLVMGEASNGRQALDLARQLEPDVILMDFCMPGMNGLEAALRIREELPDVRIILLSMIEGELMTRDAIGAGVQTCVSKGASSEELLDAIRGGSAEPCKETP